MKHLVLVTIILIFSVNAFATTNLVGYDVDKNGVWDDVQTKLDQAFEKGSDEHTATTQLAKAIQASISMLVYGANSQQMQYVANQRTKAMECFYYVHRMGAYNASNATLALVLTSEDRLAYFTEADKRLAGLSEPSMEHKMWWKSCEKPVRVLTNWPKD